MAFDGITVSNLLNEFNTKLKDGRIYKIVQTEKDELFITFKANKSQYKMLISVNASLPLIYFTETNKQAPLTAPNFCMLLRKHLQNARIISITQPGLERIIDFELQHLNELGDVCAKHLIVEIMGKHSNIIFTDEKYMIIDSIKHVTSIMSSVRQVLPGRQYFIPDTMSKKNPLTVSVEDYKGIFSDSTPVSKAIYTSLTGISPVIAEEICYLADVDSSLPSNILDDTAKEKLNKSFKYIIERIKSNDYSPVVFEKDSEYVEFASFPLKSYSDCNIISFDNISELIEAYYKTKELKTRLRQKSTDLRKVVNNLLIRDNKKYELQLKQLRDSEKKDKYKVYGELLTTYGYSVKPGEKEFETINFYDNTPIRIPLDPTLSAIENAKRYFDKYAKLKRTATALESVMGETRNSIEYLESINVAINIATGENDIKAIRNELVSTGFIKKTTSSAKKERTQNKPLHFVSSDGFHMYVGKNNIQNEELTFKFANGGDYWFHSKKFPGSHVIVKTEGKEMPDSTFEQAARLAAHFSKGCDQLKVEIDYTERKNVKKVAGAMPGFVIYHTNYSMAISPDISMIEQID